MSPLVFKCCCFFICVLSTVNTMSQGKDNARLKSYKNKSLNTDEMRRRREEEGLQLRKQKKDEQVRQIDIRWQDESLELILDGCNVTSYGTCWYLLSATSVSTVVQAQKCGHSGRGWSTGGWWDVWQWIPGVTGQQHGPNHGETPQRYFIMAFPWTVLKNAVYFTVLTYILLNRKLGHWMACL